MKINTGDKVMRKDHIKDRKLLRKSIKKSRRWDKNTRL